MLAKVKMEQLSPRARDALLVLHRTLKQDHPEFWGVQVTFERLPQSSDTPPDVVAIL